MARTRRCLVGTIVTAGVLLATAVSAVAETYTLKLTRRETKSVSSDQMSPMYWVVRPQYFYVQMTADANGRWRPAGPESQADAFKRIVKKEPKYQSENPFRGVVKFGSQEYAFALDTAPAPKARKPGAKETAVKAKAKPAANSEAARPGKTPAKQAVPVTAFSYNRLYFDFNRNGDLTDDKVVEVPADSNQSLDLLSAMSYVRFQFPRTDVTIDVQGTKVDYSFNLEGYAYSSENSCNVMVSVSSAICREGDITLEGKRHHIVLLDYNSNGRFDDVSKISPDVHLATGQLYPEPGDVLLIDPQTSGAGFDSPYDATTSDFRCPVAEMISIDGRWYDLKISPAGDKLTLTPSTVPLGSVTNRNEAFRALIYGDGKGFLKICGTKDKPIPVPAGQWKLMSYTITHVDHPAKPAEKAGEKGPADKAAKAKQGSLFGALVKQFAGTVAAGEGPSYACATATEKYKAVTVRKGETVELPFGPPYTPTVTAMSYGNPDEKAEQLSLQMGLVGGGGEECTNMMVKGSRPGKPDFTITDPAGKVVQQGSFEYG